MFDCNDFSDECLCQNIKNPVCFQITYATAENFQTSKKSVISRCKLGDIKCLVNSTQDTTEAITCVSYNKTCDGIKDCIHGDDEKFCAKTITCDSKSAILRSSTKKHRQFNIKVKAKMSKYFFYHKKSSRPCNKIAV